MDHDDEMQSGVPGLAAAMQAGRTDDFLKGVRRNLDDAGWATFTDEAVAAHLRGGELDLTKILVGPADRRIGFATQQFVERTMPACGIGLDELIGLISDAATRTGGGGTPYWMTSAVSRWCETSRERPVKVLDEIEAERAPNDIKHAVIAAGMKVDRARFLAIVIDMVVTGDAADQDIAANLLGRTEDLDPPDLAASATALASALHDARGDRVIAPLRALLAIAIRHPASVVVGMAAIEEVGTRSDRHVREAVAMEMMFGVSKADAKLAAAALSILHATTSDETATIEGIDHILSQNFVGPIADDVAVLADLLLSDGVATMKRFDSYEHHLLADTTGALPTTLTRWLVADTFTLHAAVCDVCQAVHGDPMTFDLDFSAARLTPGQAIRIARRSCGMLMLSPEAAASIIVSMMRTGPADAIPALAATLWDPLLISYWTGPRKYLEAILPELPPAVADPIADVLARLDRYSAEIQKAQDLPELRPAQHHRHLAAIRRHHEHLAIEKAARENSVFAAIAPMSVMMFGDSAIFDVVTEPGKSIRQETVLSTHEYSHELPRLDVIDPFGTWYQRAHMIRDGETG